MYQSVEYLRGIWGLEDRAYTEQEIKASAHLRAAVAAGALVACNDQESAKTKINARGAVDSASRIEHNNKDKEE